MVGTTRLAPWTRHRQPFLVEPRRAARRSWMILRLPGIATSKTPVIAASNSATPTGSTPSRAKKEICTGFRAAG